MKHCCIIISIFLLFSAVLFARSENRQAILVKITNVSNNELKTLISFNIDIENVKNKSEVYAYVTIEEYNQLTQKGYQIEEIPDRAKIYADSLWSATQFSSNPLDAYHTFEELTIELQQFAQQYPEICVLESIGKSVQGRDLWIMKITDNVTIEEYEPEFKYISSMHGDEPVGMEMCIYLIHHLLENYGVDPRITRIVDETEIWITPLMNPDGYIARQRWNANGVDLNRNFPDRIRDPFNTPEGREPETQAVMNFSSYHSFVLSANFHTGALVANYPYDSNETGNSVYTPCPDDSLFIQLCKTYSSHNLPMWNSPYFSDGITNGADWYVIYGGMQDWNYVWMECNEVTIELSDNKWPNASLLPSLWEDNRESMLSYIEAINWGVRGIISDAFTGQPLIARIEVIGIDHKIHSDPDIGDYYRMLLPGLYKFRFSADGYFSQVFDSVLVLQNYITYLDVQLFPEGGFNLTGTIKDHVTDNPIFAQINFNGNLKFSTVTDSLTGAFKITVPADTYEVEIRNDRYVTLLDTLMVSADLNLNYELQPYVFVLDLDFEINDGNFIPSDTLWQWGKPDYGPQKPYSGQKLWGISLKSSYPNNADAKLELPKVRLPDEENLVFSFWHWMEAETDTVFPDSAYDGGIMELSCDNGSTWTQLFPQQGYPCTIPRYIDSSPFVAGTSIFSGQHEWKEDVFDLNLFRGMSVQIRFYFGSDKDNDFPYAGWYIDNVAIKYPYVQPVGVHITNSVSLSQFWLSKNYPNPFNSNTTIVYTLPKASHVTVAIYNIMGQIAKVLINKEQEPGKYQIRWDGNDSYGHRVTSGVYFICMKYGDQVLTQKALVLR
jgi:murein tripeptide amidase MpaA